MTLVFTRQTDALVRQIGLGLGLGTVLFVGFWYYYALPGYTRVGYAPDQPVPFSHALHVGNLGMDCRYCHSHVAESPHSNIPSTQTCMSCHTLVKPNSPLLSAVRESWAAGTPVEWKRVHKVPDYAYFNHASHVNRGVSCVSCHGQINEMPIVRHDQPLSMGWCLNCHRQPEDHLRPNDQVYNLTWKPGQQGPTDAGRPKTQQEVGKEIKDALAINAPQTCQACHR